MKHVYEVITLLNLVPHYGDVVVSVSSGLLVPQTQRMQKLMLHCS